MLAINNANRSRVRVLQRVEKKACTLSRRFCDLFRTTDKIENKIFAAEFNEVRRSLCTARCAKQKMYNEFGNFALK